MVYKVVDKEKPEEVIALKIIKHPRAVTFGERTAEYILLARLTKLKQREKRRSTQWLLECRGEMLYDESESTVGIPMQYIEHVPFSVHTLVVIRICTIND